MSDSFIIIFTVFIIFALSALGVNDSNIIILFILNVTTPIIIYNEGNTVAIPIFSVTTVFSNIFTHNNINIDSKTVIISTLKIAISVTNISVKSYKYKIIILSVIITVINLTLTISLKNYKYKTVKIIIITNVSLTDNNIIILFILNFNLKVSAVFPLKKYK